MKKIDKDGLLLCELQAAAFENSIDKMDSSSEIFSRRFMRSKIAKSLDNEFRQVIFCSWWMKSTELQIMGL